MLLTGSWVCSTRVGVSCSVVGPRPMGSESRAVGAWAWAGGASRGSLWRRACDSVVGHHPSGPTTALAGGLGSTGHPSGASGTATSPTRTGTPAHRLILQLPHPNRSAHLPGCIPICQVWTEQARRCPPLRRRGATRPVCRHEIRGIIRFSPQSQDRGMALAANVDIPTDLVIRAAPSEQRAELSHTEPQPASVVRAPSDAPPLGPSQ